MKVDWSNPDSKISSTRCRTCLPVFREIRASHILMHFFATDSPASCRHHNDNCRNKDAPFPDRLRPWIRHVLYFTIPFPSAFSAYRGRYRFGASGSVQMRGFPFSKAERTPTAQTTLGQMELAFHIPCEESLTPQTSHPGSCVRLDGEPHDQLNKPTVDCTLESGIGECVS
jgi:hypothetical protein